MVVARNLHWPDLQCHKGGGAQVRNEESAIPAAKLLQSALDSFLQ